MALVRQRRQLPHLTLPLDHFALRAPPQPPPAVAAPCEGLPRLSDYERISQLGQGNGGTVFRARHRRTAQHFALKLFAAGDGDPSAAREAEILMLASGAPHVVRLHAVIPSPAAAQPAALALELVSGGSLAGLLRALGRSMGERPIAAVARQALLGLEALHALRVVHRDLKPANLLVGSGGEVKIADFGAGKVLRRRLDPCASYVGTAAYMSPERFDPETYAGDYDPYAADVWSLGMAILELYLGHFPLLPAGQRPDWAALMCAICFGEAPEAPAAASDEFRDFVARCLEKKAGRRPRVAVNAWALGRDPASWGEDAEEFNPDRFEAGGAHGEVDLHGAHFELVPFGAGRRVCPGMAMALVNVEFALANLLCGFDWALPEGMKAEDLSMEEAGGLTFHRKTPLILVPTPYVPPSAA